MKIDLKYLLVLGLGLFSCNTPDNVFEGELVNVIYDTDMGNDTDDILGLILLHNYTDLGLVNLLGVGTSKDHPYSARYIDLLNTWYKHGDIPIGVVVDGPEVDSIMAIPRYLTTVVDMEKDGKPVFKRSVHEYQSLLPAESLYRKLLATASDHSLVIISVGMYTNLARLLETGADQYCELSGMELVKQKVDYLCLMGGNFVEPLPECNVVTDSAASSEVFSHWPTRIVITPFELGSTIPYPASSFANDFNFVDHHPLIEAKKWYSQEFRNSPTWDMTAVLYAVETAEGYFNLSEPGKAGLGWEPDIQHHIVTEFTPDADGNHYYLVVDSIQRERIQSRFLEIVPIDPNRNE
jgi:inosine-uridine nucleoside N-ribohydrolase